MGKIKKILENELVGGTQSTDVYPVTSVKAVYDENNERLDHILNRRGIVNISTNYNSDHIAEVLTLSQAIAKVPSEDRVLGFQGRFLTGDGWVTYSYTGEELSTWSDTSKWALVADTSTLAYDINDDGGKAASNSLVTKINDRVIGYAYYENTAIDTRQGQCSAIGTFKDFDAIIIPVPENTEMEIVGIPAYFENNAIGYYSDRPNFGTRDFYISQDTNVNTSGIKFTTPTGAKYIGLSISTPNRIVANKRNSIGVVYYGSNVKNETFDTLKNDYKREVKDTLMPFYNLNKWQLGSWYSLGKGKDSSCEYYNKFKKGDTIFINIKNVIIDGTPVVDRMLAIAVYGIVDGKSNLLTEIFFGASTEKDYTEYTFNQDVDGIRVHLGVNSSVTFTDYGADVMVARNIDEISADIDEISADIDFRSITNYLSFPANYSLGDNVIPRFISKSESNVKIANGAIKINNVDGGGSILDFRISIEENIENYSNKRVWFSIESYSTQERNYTLYKNSSLIANFKSPAGYDFTPHKVKLPSFSEGDYIYISVSNTFEDAEIGCIYLSDKHPNFEIPRLQSLDYYDDKYKGIAQNGIYSGVNIYANSGDTAVSASPSIIGYRTPLSQDKNVIIDSIVLYQNSFNQGQEFDIYVGIEDQRGWFIERTRYKAKSVKQICGRTLIIPEDVAIVNAGEIVFINTGSSLWRFSTDNIDEDNLLSHISVGSNQESIIRKRPDVNLFTYIINIRNAAINDIYAKKGDLDTLETTVSNVQSQLAGIDVYTDVSTGDKYRILINNGQIYLKSLNYKKVLILGNSFTNHGVNDYWYTQRGMASSISKVDYKHLLQTALGEDAEVTNIGNAGFETGYNTSFDFSTIPFPEEEFDAVIVQLGENSSYRDDMQECWTNFLNYIKQKYPTADVVQVIGWSTGSKLQAISKACSAAGITMLNCYDETYTGQFIEGDYVTAGVSETDYNIIKPMVKTHPSDVGMLLIANRILSYWGMEELDMFRDITLQQNTGGTISVPYEQWVVGGLVSVKCDADSGYSIQSLSVNNGDITVTQRTNEYGIYYTFFMPDENVTIVPTWAQS